MNCIKFAMITGAICLILGLPKLARSQSQRPTSSSVSPAVNGTVIVAGKILDGQTKQPIAGAVVVANNQSGAVSAQQATNADGYYQLPLDPKQTYILTTRAEGYIPLNEQLAATSRTTTSLTRQPVFLFREVPKSGNTTTLLKEAPSSSPVVATTTPPVSEQPAVSNTRTASQGRVTPPKTLDAKVIYTPPLVAKAGKTTQLQALRFMQSKAELLPDAQPALDQLLAFLRDHATVEIELDGHTDNQGDFDENLRLSKQRVEVVKDYLVRNGIAANRIVTRGYGPTRPVASNNSETTRQLNRRVEMTVIKE